MKRKSSFRGISFGNERHCKALRLVSRQEIFLMNLFLALLAVMSTNKITITSSFTHIHQAKWLYFPSHEVQHNPSRWPAYNTLSGLQRRKNDGHVICFTKPLCSPGDDTTLSSYFDVGQMRPVKNTTEAMNSLQQSVDKSERNEIGSCSKSISDHCIQDESERKSDEVCQGNDKSKKGVLHKMVQWIAPPLPDRKKVRATKSRAKLEMESIDLQKSNHSDHISNSVTKNNASSILSYPSQTGASKDICEATLSNPLLAKRETPKSKVKKRLNKSATATLQEMSGNEAIDLNATVTYADLLKVLNSDTFARRGTEEQDNPVVETRTTAGKLRAAHTTPEGVKVAKGGVALPQQTKLTHDMLVRSTTFVSGCLASIISRTIQANLWFLGFVGGCAYGNRAALQYTSIRSRNLEGEGDLFKDMSRSSVDNFLLSCGTTVGQWCIRVYDAVTVLWYMYKTGELSYAYYKRYESLDKTLKISDKMDAWNARFVEGKVQFDQWEKDNEVGRKVLAGMRTFWVLEDKSYKKYSKHGKKVSKYRIVNILNDAAQGFERFCRALLKFVTGGGSQELDDLFRGIKVGLAELNFEILGQQIGSGLASVVMMSLIGALFLVSPGLTGTLAFASGCIWPTWIGGAYRRITKTINDTTEKGRRQISFLSSASEGKYDYFVRKDGSKRWYRTGQPVLGERHKDQTGTTILVEPAKTSEKRKGFFPKWKT